MFGLNILFWVCDLLVRQTNESRSLSLQILGFVIAAIGIYAWIEKETFVNFGRLITGGTLFFDPALIFVLVGVFMFCIGFAGCVGSLRENTCLLLFVSNTFSRTRASRRIDCPPFSSASPLPSSFSPNLPSVH